MAQEKNAKNWAVIFTENNARIVRAHDNELPAYKLMPNVILNPDLSAVSGLPPHLWKLEAGRVVPLTELEKQHRELHIKKHGVIIHSSLPVVRELGFFRRFLRWLSRL